MTFDQTSKKWKAYISFEKHKYNLGYFDDEIFAAAIYNYKAREFYGANYRYFNQVDESKYQDQIKMHFNKTPKSSNHRGVSFNKAMGKWVASIKHNKINHFLGYFDDEALAAQAYQLKKEYFIRQ